MPAIKVVVAHPYQQHSFKTADAFKRAGMLERYITTTYDKKNSITYFAKKLLKGNNRKRAEGRKDAFLDDCQVKQFCEFENLVMLLLHRVDKKKKVYHVVEKNLLKRYNAKLERYLRKNKIKYVVVYDTLSYEFIKTVRERKEDVTVIMDMSAPSLPYMDKMFKKCIPDENAQSLLANEMSTQLYKDKLAAAEYEVKNADYFLVASEFSKESLKYLGIPEDRVYTCRYGIEFNRNLLVERDRPRGTKIRCGFIGNVTEQKGFHYFTKIAECLGYEKFEYHVIGGYSEDNILVQQNKDKMKFYGYITHDEVLKVCDNIDVIIFPSVADGFGFSVLEAMSRGVVPLVSENSGICDLITNDQNGYKFPVADVMQAAEYCKLLDKDRLKWKQLSSQAYATAKEMTWDAYDKRIYAAINSVLKRENL